jgi:hypothetical protein
METAITAHGQTSVSLKRFVWGNICTLCAIIVTFIGMTFFFASNINGGTVIDNLVVEMTIFTGPIVVAQSYCLALARLRNAPRQRVLAEVFIFQLATLFALTIAITILATISPTTLTFNQAFTFEQGYSTIGYVLSFMPIVIIGYLPITLVSSGVVVLGTSLVAPWRNFPAEPLSSRQLLLTFGALFGSAIAIGLLWFAWVSSIVNQTSGASTVVIILVLLLLFLPAIMLVAIGAVAAWRSLTQQ